MPCLTALGGKVRRAVTKPHHIGRPKIFRRRKKKDHSEGSEAVLDQVKLLLELVGSVADGPLGVPMLKVVCTLAGKIVEIAQTVRGNSDDCKTLANHICDHLSMIAQTYHPDLRCGELATAKERHGLNEHVARLHRALEEILATVEALASRPRWRRICFHESDRRKIAVCQTSLRHIIDQFQMGASISHSHGITAIHRDVVQLKDQLRVQGCAIVPCHGDGRSHRSCLTLQHGQNVIMISGVLFA